MGDKVGQYETDPYGLLEFAVGSEDDFWCFDYCWVENNTKIRLHAVINSETGSFIMDAQPPEEVEVERAVEAAEALVDAAISWCYDNDVEIDVKGWNQDPLYFVRDLKASIDFIKNRGKYLKVERIQE